MDGSDLGPELWVSGERRTALHGTRRGLKARLSLFMLELTQDAEAGDSYSSNLSTIPFGASVVGPGVDYLDNLMIFTSATNQARFGRECD